MNAPARRDPLALWIAKIIDPHAFDDSQWTKGQCLRAELQAAALGKAEQILAMDFKFEDLPSELQAAADALDEGLTGKDQLIVSASAFAPKLAEDGGLVFTALVRAQKDGTLFLAVLTGENCGDDDALCWTIVTGTGDEARSLAARLQVIADGGGSA